MNQLVPFASPSKPDPKIEQSLTRTVEFLREYSPAPSSDKKDMLGDQYQIDINSPLPMFDRPTAKAYAATNNADGKKLIALVCEAGSVLRHHLLKPLLNIKHPNLCTLVAAGVVDISQPSGERYVLFFEHIKGQKLSTMLEKAGGKIPNNILITRIIDPIAKASLELLEAGITHGSINLDNIYYDSQAILGPCITEPCGYGQPYYYELVERMQTHPAGKGDFHSGADFYAIAVLVLRIIAGTKNLERYQPQTLARAILRQGPFMALTNGKDMPEDFFDFLWGMLGSGNNQRWTYRYLKPWLEGKHYNIIPSPPPVEGSKPFECFGTTGHSRREIAHLMRNNWDKMQETLAASSLPQWILMILRQKDLSELVARHVKTIVESNIKNETQRFEHSTRLILILDENGPLQYSSLAFHVDGIGPLFAELYNKQMKDELKLLIKFIEQNLVLAWIDLQQVKEVLISDSLSQFFSRLDRIRNMLRNEGLGFGIERILYDLNPELPCLSPLCRGKHITTLPELLRHLDRISVTAAATQDPIDTHIAAFIASKLVITNEIRLYDLAAIPDMAKNNAMIALKLFAVAQHRSGNMDLSGLTHWIAQRIVPIMQNLRSAAVRGHTLQMLLDEALEGRTQILGDLLLDGEIVNVDQSGFQKATISYKRNADRIEAYKKATNLDFDSAHLAHIIAKIFAYAALIFSIYNIIMAYQQ